MCDKIEFEKLRDRMMALEKSHLVQGEQIKTLFRSTKLQFWSIWGMTMLMLLALIYGACGSNGFNAVTKAAETIVTK